MKPVQMNGAKLVPLASFDITSRLVAVTKYNDTLARWSPLDFSVTWGPIAKADISADLGVTQSQRYFHYNPGGSGISYQTISRHSANIHIIPANDEIAKKLDTLRAGHIVQLKGHLVRIEARGYRVESSLSRTDTGGGACEVLYVQDIIDA
jgi:hypothetical protein